MHKNLPSTETLNPLNRFTEKVQDSSICKKNKKRNGSGDYEDFPVSKVVFLNKKHFKPSQNLKEKLPNSNKVILIKFNSSSISNIGDATPPNEGLNGDEHVIDDSVVASSVKIKTNQNLNGDEHVIDDSIVASSVKIEPNQNLNGQDLILILDDSIISSNVRIEPNQNLNGQDVIILLDDSVVASSVKNEPNQNLDGQDLIILSDDAIKKEGTKFENYKTVEEFPISIDKNK